MSTVIKLDLMLREALGTARRDLVTRPTGAAVRNQVMMVLQSTPESDAQLDFTDVRLMDFSCADEIIAKLLVETLGLPVRRLILRGVQENHADAIAHALERYDLVIVAVMVESTEPQLLGSAPEDWRDAFRVLAQLGRVAATPVADALAWPVARTLAALEGLARGRCLVAHPDDTFELGAVA